MQLRRLLHSTAFVLSLALPGAAAAQGRVPTTDSAAIGGEVGTFLPREEVLDSGLTFEGFYEYYFAPRTSVRLGMGWANPGFEGEGDENLRHVRIAGDLVYNWEGGGIHPFAGAGLGIYFLQFTDDGESIGDSETKFGGTLFGGAEFFNGRTFAIKAEARYHVVADFGNFDPDGLSVTIGVKKYF
jgi:hypothetical protein